MLRFDLEKPLVPNTSNAFKLNGGIILMIEWLLVEDLAMYF
jgi:hypothetical protein